MPPKSTSKPLPGATITSTKSFFLFIFSFALLSFVFLFFNYTTSSTSGKKFDGTYNPYRPLRVVLWDVKNKEDSFGTFLGPSISHKYSTYHKNCPYNCTFTTDRTDMHLADAVVFDPTALDYDNWRRIPITMPPKQPYQTWIMTSYQHHHNYPLVAQQTYKSFMDLRMTYEQNSDIPITLFCPWGSENWKPKDLLKPPKLKQKDKSIIFISSNCRFSGASARTAYVKELMEHIQIDSYGECLHNTDWEGTGKTLGPSFLHMEDKIKLMSRYKIVLAFENNNVSDYVTEKVFNALQADALPIYMGAPNIDDWLPGTDAVVKTSDFPSPAALAVYLKKLLEDEKEYLEYFKWKQGKLSTKFTEKFDRCMYNTECRICEEIATKMPRDAEAIKKELAPQRSSQNYQSVKMGGDGGHVSVPHHTRLCVTARYTLMAWIKPASFGDQRVIDKNRAGSVTGFNFDIQAVGRAQVTQGFLRLCAGEGCYMSKKGIFKDVWTHVAVVYSSEHPTVFENHVDFYINGVLDNSEIVFAPTHQEVSFPLSFGIPASEQNNRASFHGSMDNIAVFSHDLSGEEVRKYMFGLPRGDEEHLLGFWSFDDPSDTNYAHDYGRYGYDGELKSTATREPSPEKPLYLNKCH